MKRSYKGILDNASQQRIPDDLNLYPRIAEKLERKTLANLLQVKPVRMAISILAALILLTSGAYAVGRVLGYIPGVGFVEQENGILILEEPVSVDQDGYRVTIYQVVADSKRTLVRYQVDGVSPFGTTRPIKCTDPPALQLHGGKILEALIVPSWEEWENLHPGEGRLKIQYTFPALPPETTGIRFDPPCDMPVQELKLVVARSDYVLLANELEPEYESSGPGESGMTLERVIELDEKYILVGNFTDAGDLPGQINFIGEMYSPWAEDANGENVSCLYRPDVLPYTKRGNVFYWAYEVPKQFNGPLTIQINSIDIQTEPFHGPWTLTWYPPEQ